MSEPRRNAFGQPIGDAVPGWSPRPLPPRSPMEGRFCRLEPLDAERHADKLHAAYAEAPDACDWTYLSHEREPNREAFRASVVERAASTDPLHMAVMVGAVAVGQAALMRIDPVNGVVEIGHVHFAPRLQRTPASTEAIVLLMRRAFDELGYRRVEWKCDSLNAPSRSAALRLGFRYEGVFHNAMVVKGRSRDTAWYAAISSNWPALKRAANLWLSPENRHANGHQVRDLASLRGDVA